VYKISIFQSRTTIMWLTVPLNVQTIHTCSLRLSICHRKLISMAYFCKESVCIFIQTERFVALNLHGAYVCFIVWKKVLFAFLVVNFAAQCNCLHLFWWRTIIYLYYIAWRLYVIHNDHHIHL